MEPPRHEHGSRLGELVQGGIARELGGVLVEVRYPRFANHGFADNQAPAAYVLPSGRRLPPDTHLEVCRQGRYGAGTVAVSRQRGVEVMIVRGKAVPSGGTWRKVSSRVVGQVVGFPRGRLDVVVAYPKMVGMSSRLVTTRHPHEHPQYRRSGTVTTNVDRNVSVAPSTTLSKGGRGHRGRGPFGGGPAACRAPLTRKVATCDQGTPCPAPDACTPPWDQQQHAQLLVLRRGVRAAQTHVIPVRASAEGAGMT
jgi:hypothetical protein